MTVGRLTVHLCHGLCLTTQALYKMGKLLQITIGRLEGYHSFPLDESLKVLATIYKASKTTFAC